MSGVTTSWLPLAPILVPLGLGILMLAPMGRRARAGLALATALLTLLCSALLLSAVWNGAVLVSELGAWPAPFGIVMTADRLGAFMSVLASVSALLATWAALVNPDSTRERHHLFTLMAVLSAGVQMSFLTGDLFNLFVAFEVMLVASYALAVLGSTREQLREGFRYIVMNLAASALLVLACGLTYGALGTLNFAHLAQRSAELGPNATVSAISVLLLLVFAAKGALFPLGFWLPGTYPALPAATGTFFAAILTKVGAYALIRVFTTVFTQDPALPQTLLLILGSVTMLYGALGMLSQREWRSVLSFAVVSSAGYVAFGLGLGTPLALRATLSYLAVSVTVTAALFLIAAVAERAAGTRNVRARGFLDERPWLAGAFLLCALTAAGLPPTAGFIAKFALVQAGVQSGTPLAWVAVTGALLASLVTLLALLNVWRGFFWGEATGTRPAPAPRGTRLPAYAASALVAALAVGGGSLLSFTGAAASDLRGDGYVRGVLGTGPVVIPDAPAGEQSDAGQSDAEQPAGEQP